MRDFFSLESVTCNANLVKNAKLERILIKYLRKSNTNPWLCLLNIREYYVMQFSSLPDL
jgi:hypothetical protein